MIGKQLRLSIYPYPVISVVVPGLWVTEAEEHAELALKQRGQTDQWLASSYASRQIARKAFAAYYGLQDQWERFHTGNLGDSPKTDFTINGNKGEEKLKIACLQPREAPFQVGIGHTINIFHDSTNGTHIVCTWIIPTLTIVGFTPNIQRKSSGKSIYRYDTLSPMYKHETLDLMDKRKQYT